MFLWLACSGQAVEDDRFAPVKRSLEAFEAGQSDLDGGDPEAAEAHFDEALAVDTTSAVLHLWRGKARADQGDLEGAIQDAGRALELQPDLLEARYDRACWRSRAGDQEGAATDLVIALADPTLDPLFVATDPDLEGLRNSELSEVVPAPLLPAHAELIDETVFVGGEVTLTLTVLHPGPLEVVHEGPDSPVLALRKVIEDATPEGAATRTELRYSWTVLGAGEVALGPWRFRSGVFEGTATGGTVQALAPEGHTPGATDSLADDWTLPSARELSWSDPGTAGEGLQFELRRGGQPVSVAWMKAP